MLQIAYSTAQIAFKDKSPAFDPRLGRRPNAGLVSLTMTCLGYLVLLNLRETTACQTHSYLSRSSTFTASARCRRLRHLLISLPEVSFLVARIKYAPVLHHHAYPACEAQR